MQVKLEILSRETVSALGKKELLIRFRVHSKTCNKCTNRRRRITTDSPLYTGDILGATLFFETNNDSIKNSRYSVTREHPSK